jgi:aspartyl-tRNA(Asn)/glutamyl-tRNA(Gln) amidotransferase subunit C
MKLSKEEVKHIALLARLGIDETELEEYQYQLSDILENFEVLNQIDTKDLPPTTQTVSLENVLREDVSLPSYSSYDIVSNAPQQEEGFIKVQAVLE